MQIRKDQHGHRQFVLGPVEVGIASAVPAVLLGVLTFIGTSFSSQLSDQGKAIAALATQQAVTNAQLQTLTQQLANVPGLTREVAELKVQVQRNTDDIKDLRERTR